MILLCGEPGIGKSRLTQAMREQVAREPHSRLRYQCSPYYTQSALYPMITQIERAAQLTRDDTMDQKLDKLEVLLGQGTAQVADVAPLFAALLAIPPGNRYPSLSLTPQRQKERTIEALMDQLLGLARQQPVLFIWEDAHHTKGWELRAATSLARLWQSQDKRQEASDLLAPVYEWFTEGVDTADLQEARGLLETMSHDMVFKIPGTGVV